MKLSTRSDLPLSGACMLPDDPSENPFAPPRADLEPPPDDLPAGETRPVSGLLVVGVLVAFGLVMILAGLPWPADYTSTASLLQLSSLIGLTLFLLAAGWYASRRAPERPQ